MTYSPSEVKNRVLALKYVDGCREDFSAIDVYDEMLDTDDDQWTKNKINQWIVRLENLSIRDNNKNELILILKHMVNYG